MTKERIPGRYAMHLLTLMTAGGGIGFGALGIYRTVAENKYLSGGVFSTMGLAACAATYWASRRVQKYL